MANNNGKSTDWIAKELAINTDLARQVITKFIQSSVHKAGFGRVLLGLSGGIDSALSAFLAVDALGPENVMGIRMPYRTSSEGSLTDAQAVIDALDIPSQTIPITPMVEPLFEIMGEEMSNRRRGNVMARERMIILYDQSMAWDALVIGTSNKTETLLGYTTVFGDNAAAFQPIGDLYKAQVRALAAAMGVPQVVIDKPPSADLWAGQTDEGELGYTYDEVDKLLYLMVDQRYTRDEAVEAGFARAFVNRVWKQVMISHYKRTPPPIAKVSQRTIGHDFLYLRDAVGSIK